MYNYIIILSNDASSFLIHLMCLTHPSKLLRERETLSIFERAFLIPSPMVNIAKSKPTQPIGGRALFIKFIFIRLSIAEISTPRDDID